MRYAVELQCAWASVCLLTIEPAIAAATYAPRVAEKKRDIGQRLPPLRRAVNASDFGVLTASPISRKIVWHPIRCNRALSLSLSLSLSLPLPLSLSLSLAGISNCPCVITPREPYFSSSSSSQRERLILVSFGRIRAKRSAGF